jgi:ABC-type cobalamin/Fe3+-siderophores transport system ATPase subunit
VLSTHDLQLAAAVCREVVLLARGRVLAHGRTADVLTHGQIVELYGLAPEQAAQLARYPIRAALP